MNAVRSARLGSLSVRSLRDILLPLLLASAATAQSDCRAWFKRSSAGPSPRGEYGMAYDAARGRTVLFGGSSNLLFTGVNRELWEWDGQQWQQVAFTGGPSQRCDQVQAYDPSRQVVTIFGGFNGSFLADTWEWDGAQWTPHPGGPSARADAFMVHDPAREGMVMFGGLAPGSTQLGDTWLRTGTAWSIAAPLVSPSARWIQRMAFDAHRSVAVLYGGAVPGVVLGDTWEWSGQEWASRTGTAGPRYGHAMAYDPDRQRVLMFGGQNGVPYGVGLLGDTWEWDGTQWTQLSISGPPARSFIKMVYDTARHRAVLFGGYTSTGFAADTWELGVYVDCNADGVSNLSDFGCFQTKFALGDAYADCNGDGALNLSDFGCFQTRFALGCP